MSNVARIHEELTAAGLPVVSVRSRDGSIEVVMHDSATAEQAEQAHQIAVNWKPSHDHRLEDAARSGLAPLVQASAIIALGRLCRQPGLAGAIPEADRARLVAEGERLERARS